MLAQIVESMLACKERFTRRALPDYVQLETADSETELITVNGGLVTLLEIQGVIRILSAEDVEVMAEGIRRALAQFMRESGHVIEVVMDYNPDGALREVEEALAPMEASARRLGMNLGDILAERKRVLSSLCASERVYIALTTTPDILASHEWERERKHLARQAEAAIGEAGRRSEAANMLHVAQSLRTRHYGFVSRVAQDLRSLGIAAGIIPAWRPRAVDERGELRLPTAATHLAMMLQPDHFNWSFRPVLPGDPLTPQIERRLNRDFSGLWYPKLSGQLCVAPAEAVGFDRLRIGRRWVAPIAMTIYPSSPQPFNELFRRCAMVRLPFRAMIRIEGNGMPGLFWKSFVASFTAWASSGNRLLRQYKNDMQEAVQARSAEPVRLQMSFATWGYSAEEMEQRAEMLSRVVAGWGDAQVTTDVGDPVESYLATVPGVLASHPANHAVPPLAEATRFVPLRPASLWSAGAVLFRTRDGKLMPYQPMSAQQESAMTLLVAPPRSGKSATMATTLVAIATHPGLKRLPYISVIDIGNASKGPLDLLRDELPPADRDKVLFTKLENLTRYAINPLDTTLGCNQPTSQEKAWMVAFLSLLLTAEEQFSDPRDTPAPPDGTGAFLSTLLDVTFETMADERTAKAYVPHALPEVDRALAELQITVAAGMSWFEVRDALFARGLLNEATRAHRQAMPLLSDLASFAGDARVRDQHGKHHPGGMHESIIDYFIRMLSAALEQYPVLTQATRFDVGVARVVSIDLSPVCQGEGPADRKRRNVMYMLARQATARWLYMSEESTLRAAGALYQRHWRQWFADYKEDVKAIFMDEFHQVRSAPLRQQIEQEMRTKGKEQVGFWIATQAMDDLPEVYLGLATTIFVLRAPIVEKELEDNAVRFGLSRTEIAAIGQYCRGPTREGVTMFARFATSTERVNQLLTLTLGPIELWAYSTTGPDVALRDRCYQEIEPRYARMALARLFPGGSAASELEQRKRQASAFDDTEAARVMDQAVAAVVNEARRIAALSSGGP